MQINEAIKRTRAVARCKRRCAETLKVHPFISRARAGRYEEIEAEALETVCDELEAIRKKQKAIDAVYEDAVYLRGEVERLRGELEEQRARRIRQVFEHR